MYDRGNGEIMNRLLRKKDIADRLGASWQKASRLLAERGVMPVDYGSGRGNGLRWLESAVDAVIAAMHQEAQPRAENRRPARPKGLRTHLHDMSAAAVYELVANSKRVQ